MSEMWSAVWSWVYKAPLPAVIAMMLLLGGWVVFAQDNLHKKQAETSAQLQVMKEKDTELKADVKAANDKLDKLLEAVLELRAEAKAARKADKTKEGQKP